MKRAVSFSIVGATVFVGVQLALYLLVEYLYWSPLAANVVTLALSVWASYELNQHFTWHHLPRHFRQAHRFLLSRFATMALSAFVFYALVRLTGIYYLLASAIGVGIGTIANFIIADKWVFTEATPPARNLALTWKTAAKTIILIGCIVAATWLASPKIFMSVLFTILAVVALAATCLNLLASLYVHRDDSSRVPAPVFSVDEEVFSQRFAVLMPARREGSHYGHTILNAFLTQRDHPDYRIFCVVCDDDVSTARVAIAAAQIARECDLENDTLEQAQQRYTALLAVSPKGNAPFTKDEHEMMAEFRANNAPVQVIIFPLGNEQPSKPKQLNFAFAVLEHRGFSAFTILDAESMAQPGLFSYVDHVMNANPDAAVVQGAVQLMDPFLPGNAIQRFICACKRWFSWHNMLEYHRWFSGQMSFQSDNRFVPLGGNTLFIRTEVLSSTRGWPLSLTEDCALGVRISTQLGGQVIVFYEPRLATREETPPTVHDLVKQRTRWNQGFLESFIEGQWQAMPTTKQRFLAFWILSNPFFQALSAFLLPLAITMMLTGILKSPVLLVLVMFFPVLLTGLMVVLQLEQLYDFGRTYRRKIPWYAYVIIVLTQLFYQWLLSYAALRAVIRHFTGQISWQSPARSGDLLTTHTLIKGT